MIHPNSRRLKAAKLIRCAANPAVKDSGILVLQRSAQYTDLQQTNNRFGRKASMIPAYFWKATHAPGGFVRPLSSDDRTVARGAADSYERWLRNSDPLDMLVVQSCDLEKDWAREPTGHKAFDEHRRRTSSLGVTSGHTSSNVQTSFIIRPYSETECNGRVFPPGALRAADLKYLKILEDCRLDGAHVARRWMNEPGVMNQTTNLYVVHHPKATRGSDGRHELMVHGWVLTDAGHNLLRHLQTSKAEKSSVIMDCAIKAFTLHHLNPVDVLRIEDGEVKFVDETVRALLSDEARELADEAEGRVAVAERPRQR